MAPSPLTPTALLTFLSSSSSFGSFTQTIRARDSQLLLTVINLLILVLPPSLHRYEGFFLSVKLTNELG